MKYIYAFLVLICCCATQLSAQDTSNQRVGNVSKLAKLLHKFGTSPEEIKLIIKGVIENPELYDEAWSRLINTIEESERDNWGFLKDLNMDFKTFQSQEDNALTSLGFSYDFSFDWSKYSESENSVRTQHSLSVGTKGNVAFRKTVNPTDFLEADLKYTFGQFRGGVISMDKDTLRYSRLNEIEDRLVMLDNPQGEEAQKLWEEFGANLKLSNQFYYGINLLSGIESNQDFSNFQWKGGIHLGLGVKAWDKNATLSKLNILDYPFALLRLITKTDTKFQPRGSVIPTALVGLDYIIPIDDVERETAEGKLNPYPRFKFETGYRTLVSDIAEQSIFFVANYRLYQELGASQEIRNQNLSTHSYLILSLQSSKGYYVSYSIGKLPFDRIDDRIYEMGFQYKF